MKTASLQYYLWKKIGNHNDPGRFDVCRGCPLKVAILKKKSKNIN